MRNRMMSKKSAKIRNWVMIVGVLVIAALAMWFMIANNAEYSEESASDITSIAQRTYKLEVEKGNESKTLWYLNGKLMSSGSYITKVNTGYLVDGENTLTGVNGDTKETFNITYEPPIFPNDKTSKMISLLQPIELYQSEDDLDKDSDGDGLTDKDETEKYSTDPLKDYSNPKKISDLAYALTKESGAEVDEDGNVTVKHKMSSEDGKCTFNLICTGPASEMSGVVLSGVQTGDASFEVYGTKDCKMAASVELRDGMLGNVEDYVVVKQLSDGELEIVEKIVIEEGKSTLDISSDGVYTVLSGISMDEMISNGVKNLKNSEIAFIIDNSGSMFSEEYISNKVKIAKEESSDEESSNEESSDETAIVAKPGAKPKEKVRIKQEVKSQSSSRKKSSYKSQTNKYSNDVEFKRLDLMKSLVDRLENLKDADVVIPSYSVSAFTKDYMQVQKMSKSGQETKKSIDSLRTDYQEFTGTAVNVAITRGVKEFSEGIIGKKTMIVLTDGGSGKDNIINDFDNILARYDIKDAVEEANVNLILVGLGNANYDELISIATDVNGTVLLANSPDALDRLVDKIMGNLKTGTDTKIKDEENAVGNATVLADTGFTPAKDGFTLENFGSKQSGGTCYGFSLTSKMIFEGENNDGALQHLEYTKANFANSILQELLGTDLDFPEINLSEEMSRQLTTGNVSGIKFDKFSALNEWSDKGIYGCSVLDKGEVLRIKPDLGDSLTKLGGEIKAVMAEEGKTFTAKLESGNKKIKGYEQFYIDAYAKPVVAELAGDKEVLKLLTRNQMSQANELVENALSNKTKETMSYKDMQRVIGHLKTGKPVMMSISCASGGHSVLAYRVSQSVDNPNVFLMNVYDSNEPMTDKVMVFTRTKEFRNGKIADSYEFSYKAGDLYFTDVAICSKQTVKSGKEIAYSDEISKE